MAHRLSLSKLTGKQGPPPALPVMSFRYNPCEEGIEELQPQEPPPATDTVVLPRNESAPSVVLSSSEADRLGKATGTNSRDSSTERRTVPQRKEDAASNRLFSLADRDPLGATDLCDTPARVNLVRRHSLENLTVPDVEILKPESSPVKDYLAKLSKRSAVAAAVTDSTAAGVLLVDPKLARTTPEPTDRWYSTIQKRITKRLEERRHPSGRSKKEDDAKLAPLVGKEETGSEDDASRSETPIEEGQDAAEEDVTGTRSAAHPSGHKDDPFDPDLDTWEFVEQVESPQKSAPLHVRVQPVPPVPTLQLSGPNFAAITKAALESNGILLATAVGFLAIVLPLPSFLSGLIVGCIISLLLFSLAWFLFVPTRSRTPFEIPDYRKLPPLRVPRPAGGDGGRNDVTSYEGWMCQLPSETEYHIETHHMNNTLSVHLVLVGTTLRIRRPKHAMPRRAMWNEKKAEPMFIGQRHFNLSAAKVMLLPEKLSKERLWNRKYPICLLVPSEDHYSQQCKDPWASLLEAPPAPGCCPPDEELPREYRDCSVVGRDAAAASKDTSYRDGGGTKDNPSQSDHEVLYLFARTCREKEEWFRRFQQAIRSSGSDARSKRPQYDESDEPPLSYDSYMADLMQKHREQQWPQQTRFPSGRSGATAMSNLSGNTATSLLRTTTTGSSSSTQWINMLVGRLFYDVFTCQEWSDVVRQRIQRKLNRIKVPFFMEELTVTEIHLGSQLPYIRRTSEAVVDKQGTWVDLDLTYNGAFQMTLSTKLNLMRLKRSQHEEMQSFTMNHDGSEEESAASSEEEDGPDRAESSTVSKDAGVGGAGTGKKLLDLVDKIAQSKYFQQATENRYIKRKMEEVSNTPLVLTVEVSHLVGTLALNVPPPPTDRIWYGFRTLPKMELVARPKLGEKEVTFARVTERIEKMLFLEFQRILVMPNMDDFMIPIMQSYLPVG